MLGRIILILMLVSVVITSSLKINQYKDSENKTKLISYASVVVAASSVILYVFYKIFTTRSQKDIIIDAVLNDFLEINESKSMI